MKKNAKKIDFKQILPYIIRAIMSSILITIIIYYAVTEWNEAIINILNIINENNIANEFIKIAIPIILMICLSIELGKYVITNADKNEVRNEKNKKATNKV